MTQRHRQKAECCPGDDWWLSFLDGTVDVERKTALERHLLECGGCLESLASLIRLIRPDTSNEEERQVSAIGRQTPADQAGRCHQEAWGGKGKSHPAR